ncbi:MAG: DUF1232 domain-containing protein [Deltaproteobacteria bacterium]|nr:DUF1232 domain-containing protein [Deltaproteobacteria bacterium]
MTEFQSFLARAIPAIPADLKVLLRILQDEDLDDGPRLEAAGAILYTLSAGDLVPDSIGVLGYVDDALVCRIALARAGEAAPRYRERYPKLYETLATDLASAREFLGDDIFDFVGRAAVARTDNDYKGKKARDFLTDPEASGWLADEASAEIAKLVFRKPDIERELKKVDTLVPRLKQKLDAARARG